MPSDLPAPCHGHEVAVQARRRAGFQAALRQVQFLEPRRQGHRRRIAHAPAGVVLQPDVNLAVEEGACGQHHGRGQKADAELRHRAAHLVALDDQVVASFGENGQIGLIFESTANGLLVQHAIGLGARGAHRRALRGIQDAELDAGFVGRSRHRPTQRINLAHQMPLADAADRRIATHRSQRVEVVRQQQRIGARPRCGKRGLGAGMAAADNDDIETGGVEHGNRMLQRGSGPAILRQAAEKSQFLPSPIATNTPRTPTPATS